MNNTQLDMVLGYLNEGTMIDMDEYQLEGYNDYLEEGANLEMRKKYKSFTKDLKEASKKMKKAIKENDKDTFDSTYADINEKIDSLKKDIRAIDSSVGSVVFGYYATITLLTAKDIKNIALACIPIVGIFTSINFGIDTTIKYINNIIGEVKAKGSLTPDAFNSYKIKMETNLDKMKDDLKKVKSYAYKKFSKQ